ncbi:MAG: sugar phosphate isomerase/epimerase [Oscillospiraceae bacterium]|nr:sugar phosphate isomerase/epimerase [Oscillospiraceae bacterium]
MKYAVWSNYLNESTATSPEEMVVAFAKKGWFNLELSTEHAEELIMRGDPMAVGAEFKAFADSRGVTFPQGHLWLGVDIVGPQPEESVKLIKSWLDLFYAVGVKACVLHAGGGWMRKNGASEDEIDAANVKSLKALCAHIEGRDMYICLENLIASYTRVSDLRRLIDAVGSSQLKICLDTGHLNITGGSPAEFVGDAGPLLKALHIDDNEGEHDQHLIPYGTGNVLWDELLCALAAMSEPYDGLFNFEIPGESGAPPEILLAKLDYLREVAAYMIGKIR